MTAAKVELKNDILVEVADIANTSVLVRWNIPGSVARSQNFPVAFEVAVIPKTKDKTVPKRRIVLEPWNLQTLMTGLQPRHSYIASVNALSSTGSVLFQGKTDKFRMWLSKSQIVKLAIKAQRHCFTKDGKAIPMQKFEYLYRTKPPAYWAHVERNRDGVMEIGPKDNNGHSGTCLKGGLRGLFLEASLYMGTLPFTSPFGEKRLNIPVKNLLKPDQQHHLYFADFYCLFQQRHYVTIVVTRPDTEADAFCEAHFLALNPETNPFLCMVKVREGEGGGDKEELEFWVMSEHTQLWVEVYYTENVSMTLAEKFEHVHPIDFAFSAIPDGRPANPNCQICCID